jgi:hypothetical protein
MAKRAAATKPQDQFITQTHPLHDEWEDIWRLSGENYEGDGGYLDGSNIVPHPREVTYAHRADGTYDFTTITGEKPKLRRRKQLARYDNFAQALTDVFVDHQYAKGISRTFASGKPDENYMRWIENVDGDGTHLDDWLKDRQTLAHTYGHLFAMMERGPSKRPDGKPARSRAEQGDLRLVDYLPPDALDWLAPRRKLSAIKFVEAVERNNLREPSIFSSTYHGQHRGTNGQDHIALNLEYLFGDADSWTRYDNNGTRLGSARHGFGELPVVPFYSRRRARIPVIGRPLLRDPRLFRDHFNLVSELRELLRSQTFSLLHIQLQDGETVEAARGRMGDHAGTDTVLFTMGGAAFIAPADGPVAAYVAAIDSVERKMFRLIGLPWEGDSRDAEAADSRRLKAMDLNRTLAGHADEAERADYGIARLFYIGFYGRDMGLRRWQENPPNIKHPDEFHTEELMAVVEDVKAAMGLHLGKTANAILRKRTVPIVLKDLDQKTRETIESEIDAAPMDSLDAANEFSNTLARANAEPADKEDKPPVAA